MENIWQEFEKWYLTVPANWATLTKKGWLGNAYEAGWKAAQQNAQRTCAKCGLNFTDGANSFYRQGHCPHCGASR